jgi:hypothetical protein
MYNAMDQHLLNCTLWNYTASNRNDASCGDGWNQEDLSVFSRDQGGGRAEAGFVRPFVRACQGVLKEMKFERESGVFSFTFDADPAIDRPTEVCLPAAQYASHSYHAEFPNNLEIVPSPSPASLQLRATTSGVQRVVVRPSRSLRGS